jgi:hypothetical protein
MTEEEINQQSVERWHNAWRVVMDKQAQLEKTSRKIQLEEIAKTKKPLTNKEKKAVARKAATNIAQKKINRWVKRGVQPRIDHIFFYG